MSPKGDGIDKIPTHRFVRDHRDRMPEPNLMIGKFDDILFEAALFSDAG